MRALLVGFLLYVLFPLWLIAGATDYALHRRTQIEKTSGAGESWLHVLQAVEIGIPLLIGLFMETTSLVLVVLIGCAVAHTLTAIWDASYSAPRRYISPLEQHVHSHLEYIPLIAVAIVVMLHWDAFLAVFGVGTSSWSLHPRPAPLPLVPVSVVLIGVFGLQGALLAEETLRTARNRTAAGRSMRPPDASGETLDRASDAWTDRENAPRWNAARPRHPGQ